MQLSTVTLLSALLGAANAGLVLDSKASHGAYCQPTDPCWPSAKSWSAFNATVGGRLQALTPWAAPCYANSPSANDAACAPIKAQYTNSTPRVEVAGVTQIDQWSYCYSNQGDADQCMLDASNPQTITNGTCALGRISPFAVAVISPQDIQNTLAFAQAYRIKVVIKNTGHDYFGRSTSPGSLMIWTHKLNALSYSNSFTPSNCSKAGASRTITMGSGAIAHDIYAFADKNNASITGGAYSSVGLAGGFAMGGGHGPLGPKVSTARVVSGSESLTNSLPLSQYGLAVDNIVQYKIVTADRRLRTVNACQDPDLFWALRGGGGGVWGVVTEVTIQVHPSTPMQTFYATGTFANDAAMRNLLQVLADNQLALSKINFAGYIFANPNDGVFTLVYALPDANSTLAKTAMQPVVDALADTTQYNVARLLQLTFPTLYAFVLGIVEPAAANGPVAFNLRLATRLIPTSVFASDAKRNTLLDAIMNGASALKAATNAFPEDQVPRLPIQITSASPPPQFTGNDTAANPAWRNNTWQVVYTLAWTSTLPVDSRPQIAQAVGSALQPLKDLTPGGGTYVNEGDVLEPNWQQTYFGSNYDRLVSIKKRYDPGNVFTVFKGIGYANISVANDYSMRCYTKA